MNKMLARLGVLILLAFALIVPSSAAYNCDALVADEANLFGSGLSEVTAAAEKVANLGADVRVRTIPNLNGSPTLDRYVRAVKDQCPSWQDTSRGVKNNLVLLIISVEERKKGLFFGSLWNPALSAGKSEAIMEREMSPRLRDGDMVGAYTKTLQAVATALDAQLNPKPVEPSKPVDFSGLWSVLMWIVILVATGGLALFGWRVFESWRERAEKLSAAKGRARSAKAACSTAINAIDEEIAPLAALIASVKSRSSAEDVSSLETELNNITREVDTLRAEFGQLAGHSTNNPDEPERTALECEQIAEKYENLAKGLAGLGGRASGIKSGANEIDRVIKTAAAGVARTESVLAESRKTVELVTAKGLRAEVAVEKIGRADALMKDASGTLGARRFGDAIELMRQATALAREAVADAQALPAQQLALTARADRIDARIRETQTRIASARAIYQSMEAEFVVSSLAPVAGNGTEAGKRLEGATRGLEKATASLSMEKQNWAGADEQLAKAERRLEEAAQLLSSIETLAADLADAKAKAPEEIALADADIGAASLYLRDHASDVDLDALERELKEAHRKLVEAKEEAEKSQPEYLKVVKLALSANRQADRVRASAGDAVELVARMRRNLKSTLEEAERSIRAADSYIAIHEQDVLDDARLGLASARKKLEMARRSSDLADALKHAKAADQSADGALAKAEGDVRSAEHGRAQARRRAEVRRAQASSRRSGDGWGNSTIIVGSSHTDYGGSSWGSSSSSSSSSSSDFGGSSSSFGSSDFGGSSSSW
ncbi:MAG: TPM domain-containing protein [Candidatus Pacebacteria bacterium]|nr:TPM domain-containing protein [Candidatus Paceibacterota bacterium]MBP9840675.1 TPM domain-containing protein [Candidatus Paceibacterota bacterium]